MLNKYNSAFVVKHLDLLAYCLIGLLALFHFFANLRIEDYSSDSSVYIGLSRSILDKGAYEFNFEPHTHFPPGFPLVLAGLSSVFGNDHVVFIRALAIMGMLALLACYHLLCRMENKTFALAACLIVGTSPYYFQAVTQVVGSDVPFFLASTLTLLLAAKLSDRRNFLQVGVVLVLFVICVIASVLLRTAGVSLLVGMCAWLAVNYAFRREAGVYCLKTYVPALLAGALVLSMWVMWTAHTKNEIESRGGRAGTYIDNFWAKDPHQPELGRATVPDLLSRVGDNLVIHAAHLAEILTRIRWIQQVWYSPFVWGVAGLIALGWAGSVADNRDGFAPWYFSAYMFVYLFWPFDEGPRFMLPVVILAVLYLWRGARFLKSGLTRQPKDCLWYGFIIGAGLTGYATFDIVRSAGPAGLQSKFILMFWFLFALLTAMGSGVFHKKLGAMMTKSLQAFLVGKLARPIVMIGVFALLISGLGVQFAMALENLNINPQTFVHYPSTQAANWIARHALPSDVIMAQQIALIHRITGRRVVSFTVSSDPHKILAEIRKRQVKFLVVNTSNKMTYYLPTEAERLKLLQSSYPTMFELVHSERSLQIFRLRA